MKLYKTYAVITSLPGDTSKPVWTTSEAKAASARASLMKNGGYKRDEIKTDEVDVPTKRNELVVFLNGL